MKYLIIVISVSAISIGVNGQYYEKRNGKSEQNNYLPREITITLNPIVAQNGKYYFDGRRVKFEDIVLPLLSVHDKTVDHRLKVVRTMTDLRKPLHYVGLAYLMYASTHVAYTQNGFQTYLYTFIGVLVFHELFDASIALAKRSTINRYNDVVLQPAVSFQPNSGVNLGMSLRF